MLGLMQNQPLMISSLIEHANRHHGEGEIVSRRVEGDLHRCTYKDIAARSRQVAHALDSLQLAFGARVATLAWNGYRHLELYFGVSGTGRVLHTLNPRLHPDQIAWIANHAQDQVLCFDMTFLAIIKAMQGKATTIKHYVALCDADKLPADTGITGLVSYEAWIAPHPPSYPWPEFDENSASSMCYTSGTTGNPKAALYSANIKSGRLKALAVTTAKRSSAMPELPTMAEAGATFGLANFDVSTWFGLFGPAKLTPDMTARLNKAFVDALGSPELKTRMATLMAEPAPSTPEQFTAFVRGELIKFEGVVKASGARAD